MDGENSQIFQAVRLVRVFKMSPGGYSHDTTLMVKKSTSDSSTSKSGKELKAVGCLTTRIYFQKLTLKLLPVFSCGKEIKRFLQRETGVFS